MTPSEARALLATLERERPTPHLTAVERELWVERMLPCHSRVGSMAVSSCVGALTHHPSLEQFAASLEEIQAWWERQDAIGVVTEDPVVVAGPEVASLALARARAALRGSA